MERNVFLYERVNDNEPPEVTTKMGNEILLIILIAIAYIFCTLLPTLIEFFKKIFEWVDFLTRRDDVPKDSSDSFSNKDSEESAKSKTGTGSRENEPKN